MSMSSHSLIFSRFSLLNEKLRVCMLYESPFINIYLYINDHNNSSYIILFFCFVERNTCFYIIFTELSTIIFLT